MAKHKYEELELDEHNLAIHWRERDGDEYWGIKLGEGDPLADDEANWQGENRLGKVLDQVRQMLLDGYKAEIKY